MGDLVSMADRFRGPKPAPSPLRERFDEIDHQIEVQRGNALIGALLQSFTDDELRLLEREGALSAAEVDALTAARKGPADGGA